MTTPKPISDIDEVLVTLRHGDINGSITSYGLPTDKLRKKLWDDPILKEAKLRINELINKEKEQLLNELLSALPEPPKGIISGSTVTYHDPPEANPLVAGFRDCLTEASELIETELKALNLKGGNHG